MTKPANWLEDPISDQEAERIRAKVIPKIAPSLTLDLRHIGGEVRTVIVEQATEDGALHVRWDSGAGVYVVHVFRTIAPQALPGPCGYGFLFRTARSRIPLQWQAVNPEEARELWRRMTRRGEPMGRDEWFARRAGKKL